MRLWPILFVFCGAVLVSEAAAQTAPAETPAPVQTQEQIEIQFQTALVLQRLGRPAVAARIYTAILANDPSLVRVRLELARAYFEAREWARSRQEFLRVLSADLPDPVRQRVLQFIRAIDARRGFEWTLTASLSELGDSRRFATDTITLDFGAGPVASTLNRNTETALGLSYSGSVSIREPIAGLSSPSRSVSAFGQLSAAGSEGPGRDFDDIIVTAEIGVRAAFERATVSAAPFVSRRFLDGELYEDRLGFGVSADLRSEEGTTLSGRVSLANIDNRDSETLDGHQLSLSLRATTQARADTTLGASLSYEDTDVRFDLENDQTTRLTVFAEVDLTGGFTVAPRLFTERRRFETPSPLFTASPDERTFGVGLRLETSRFIIGNGFTPFIDGEYRETRTDIEAFNATDYNVTVGLERRF